MDTLPSGDTLSSSPVPAADAPAPQQAPAEAQKDQPGKKGPKTCGMQSVLGSCCMLPVLLDLVFPLSRLLCRYERLQMPSGEDIMQQEFMNNCAVRTVISGVMGSALGLLFGVVMGSMDSAVSPASPASKDHRLRTGAHCSLALLTLHRHLGSFSAASCSCDASHLPLLRPVLLTALQMHNRCISS